MQMTKRKKPSSKGYILYNSNPMTSWIKQNDRDSKKLSGCQELGRRAGQIRRAQGISRTVQLSCVLLL